MSEQPVAPAADEGFRVELPLFRGPFRLLAELIMDLPPEDEGIIFRVMLPPPDRSYSTVAFRTALENGSSANAVTMAPL